MGSSHIGMVVVGLGRAGRARVRDLAASAHFRLAGVVSRRPEHATVSWADALADPAVGAVAICTENALHERQAREALAAGKHVLVEYPLCLSSSAGLALFALADRAGRRLHVEHIELLGSGYRELRAEVRRLGALREASLRSRGPSEGWIGDPSRAGFPSFSGIARLHRLVDLFGPLEVREAALEGGATGFTLRARLCDARGAPIEWVEERRPGLARGASIRFALENGVITAVPARKGEPLFAIDLERFGEEVGGRRESAEDRARELHCLELAAEIERRCG